MIANISHKRDVTRRSTLYVALLCAGAALPSPASAAEPTSENPTATGVAQAPQVSTTPDEGIQDIIVTAQKREQNLQSVPVSITAFNQSALAANRVMTVLDLNAIAPNLTVRATSGGQGLPNYTMRGLNTAGGAIGTDKGVSLYLDGVYLQNVIGSIFDLADIERIEVLRGPQGTLFGRNATGGAISIITRNPTGDFGIRQELTYGNFRQFRSKTRVDLPAWGPLKASVTYVHSEHRGDTRNLGAGTSWDWRPTTDGRVGILTSPEYLGSDNVDAVAVALKLDAVDGLDLSYKFDYMNSHYTPEAQGVAGLSTASLGTLGAVIDAELAGQPNPADLTRIGSRRPDAVNNAFSTPGYTRNMGHNFTATYAFDDQISIKNILAFRSSFNTATNQLDGLGGLVNVTGLLGPVGEPFLLIGTAVLTRERQWSNETQLNINVDAFTLTAGVIHFHNHAVQGGFGGAPASLSFTTIPGYVIPDIGNKLNRVTTNSDAVFVQPEIHLTDRLDLVGGARLTRDRKSGEDNGSPVTFPFRYEDSSPTFLLGLNFRPTDHVFTYVKFATGYISGGLLGTLSFDPERSKSYEAGIKADLLDRRLRANLALFHVDYTGLQITTPGFNVGLPMVNAVQINGGDARANGFELETTAVPLDGLTLQASAGFTDFKYTSVDPVIGTLASYRPINRPKWTATASVQYETGELFHTGHLIPRLDINYRSKTFLAFNVPTPEIAEATTTDPVVIVNGRVALAGISVAGSTAEIALWARNLTNNRSLANVTSASFVFPGSFERERSFGIDMNIEF